MKKEILVLMLSSAVLAMSSCGENRVTASTFDQCLLLNLSEAQSDAAARLVLMACRDQFPAAQQAARVTAPISPCINASEEEKEELMARNRFAKYHFC